MKNEKGGRWFWNRADFEQHLYKEKMETRKIALACFIGGILCAAVALIFAPKFWTIGLLAGFVGGYLSYEFKEVLRAIPRAYFMAVDNTRFKIYKLRKWLNQPHPFVYLSAIMSMLIYALITYQTSWLELPKTHSYLEKIFIYIPLTLLVFGELTPTIIVLVFTLSFIGARAGERCYWQPFVSIEDKEVKKHIKQLEEKGYREKPLTYLNTLRWSVIGLGVIVLFFVWTLWKYLAIGIWFCLKFIGRFGWHLFKLIHSEKRVLCAIDGTLGGAISYACLYAGSTTLPEKILLVFFGGLLGAGIGIANWEIVSKRLIHVQVNNN